MTEEQQKQWNRLDSCMKFAMYGTNIIAIVWLAFKVFVYFKFGKLELGEIAWLFLGLVIWFILKEKRDSIGNSSK